MRTFSKADKDEMRRYVIEELVTNYNYNLEVAKKSVNESVFNQMLEEDTDYVFHYSIEYWASDVAEEVILVNSKQH